MQHRPSGLDRAQLHLTAQLGGRPDLTFLERWEFQGSHPNVTNKIQPIRQPVIAPIPESCTVFGNKYPISFETMLMGLAEKLELPGFGKDAFGDGLDLKHPDDLYLRQVANLAFGEEPDGSKNVPDADDRELKLFLNARKHLPVEVFDAARWEAIVGTKMWRKVVYVLNRGGRFEEHHPDRPLLWWAGPVCLAFEGCGSAKSVNVVRPAGRSTLTLFGEPARDVPREAIIARRSAACCGSRANYTTSLRGCS